MSTTSSALVDLTSETNKIVLNAVAENNRRQIAYAKNFWGIVSRPYPGTDFKANVDETIDRAEKVLDLTIADLEVTAKTTIEFAEHVIAQASKARGESLEAARNFAKSGVTSIKNALETTEERLDTLSKRLDHTVDEAVYSSQKAAQ